VRWSKDIFTYLLFVVIAFLIWWANAWHDQETENGSVQAVQQSNIADDSRQKTTEKRFELPVEVMGVPQGKSIRVFPSKADVYVRVRMSEYEGLQKESFRVWCTYPASQTDVLVLHVDANENESLSFRIEPEEVEYLIEEY